MADPVQKPAAPAAKNPAAPKGAPAGGGAAKEAPKGAKPAGAAGKPQPKEVPQKQKSRLEPLNVNLGRSGLPQESALPYKKEEKAALGAPAAKAAPAGKPAPGAKPAAPAAKGAPAGKPAAPAAKGAPAGKPAAPAAKGAPAGKPAPGAKPAAPAAPAAKPAAPAPKAAPAAAAKPAAPRAKSHYFIIENLCVGCGLCVDKCPPKVKAIGYKFYGDVQEGGYRAYIDQDACISCASCFNSAECPAGALIEVKPDGEVLDYTYTPPERLDFDLRFLHRFHREVR